MAAAAEGPSQPPRDPAHQAAVAAEAALIGLYAWAQVELLRGVWVVLCDTTHTLAGVQAAVGPMRRLVARVTAALQVRTGPLLDALVDGYTAAGALVAERDVAALRAAHPGSTWNAPPAPPTGGQSGVPGDSHPHPGGHLPPPPAPPGSALTRGGNEEHLFDLSMHHGERAAEAIRRDMAHSLGDVRERITRLPQDVYKAIAPHGAIRQVLDNGWTPQQSQAAAWRVFLASGVTGFTDRAGRRWNLATYVEMAVRTAAMRAFNDSHLARMRVLGVRYFTVTGHLTACPLCWPWEGQVISDGLQPDPGVPVAGTLNDAIAAGLFHPNCRHTLQAYWPGISPAPDARPPWGAQQQQEYDDTQRQRALERAIRAAKQRAEYALDPAEATRARREVRAGQARLRAHLDGRPHLSRHSAREQPHLGYGRVRIPTA